MYDATTAPNIATIRRALDTIGKSFPKPVLIALAEHDKIRAAARAYDIATPDQVLDAAATALLEDRDPADCERVRHLLASRALGAGTAMSHGLNLTHQAEGRVQAAITAHVDTILATLAAPANEAGEHLAAANELLGGEDDPKILVSRGVAAVEAWTRAEKARTVLRTIGSAWAALANLTGFAPTSVDPTLRLADLDLATFEKVGRNADAWNIVRAGGLIRLADATTIRERSERIQKARQQRESKRVNAVRDEYARLHGAGARR